MTNWNLKFQLYSCYFWNSNFLHTSFWNFIQILWDGRRQRERERESDGGKRKKRKRNYFLKFVDKISAYEMISKQYNFKQRIHCLIIPQDDNNTKEWIMSIYIYDQWMWQLCYMAWNDQIEKWKLFFLAEFIHLNIYKIIKLKSLILLRKIK